ncbi:MAG TPA: YHYH protein [Candidatus Acidoferrum sp.]|nr:YHYH protein [Candidatus Acidoferrum sp.]
MNLISIQLMQTMTCRSLLLAGALTLARPGAHADPLITSWYTGNHGKYARIYTSLTNRTNGVSATTWTGQTLPAYSGVREVDYSASWVYIRTTGLGGHTMGPWSNPNLPKNQGLLYRFPRSAVAPATSPVLTSLGAIGIMVDGVSIFDTRDAFSYKNSAGTDATPVNGLTGDGIWNRDAWANEASSFDAAYAHQPQNGQYHYHASPLATRYLLGDNVLFFGTPDNNSPKTYAENTNTTVFKHSPIIGWMNDGLPLYGPYGYSSAMDASSPVRRMVSGYVKRDGSYGTTDLNSAGRHTLPAWGAAAQGRSATLTSSQYGRAVSTTYPIGHYIEDYDYLGDLGYAQGATNNPGGVLFDLNKYNARFCVTPEYPGGTYAYFESIQADGTPFYPYHVGRWFYGNPTGGTTTSITESVTTNFVGGANMEPVLSAPALSNSVVTLVWSAVEGGTYQVLSTPDFRSWGTNATGVAAVLNQGTASLPESAPNQFFRVARTGLATYDTK